MRCACPIRVMGRSESSLAGANAVAKGMPDCHRKARWGKGQIRKTQKNGGEEREEEGQKRQKRKPEKNGGEEGEGNRIYLQRSTHLDANVSIFIRNDTKEIPDVQSSLMGRAERTESSLNIHSEKNTREMK